MTDTILNYLLCSVCGGLITWVTLGAKRMKAMQQVIKALSHDALFSRCEQLIERGKISTDDLENLNMLYEAYHELGLNGAGKELYNRAKSLPLE